MKHVDISFENGFEEMTFVNMKNEIPDHSGIGVVTTVHMVLLRNRHSCPVN